MFWGYRLFRTANERQGKMELTHGTKLKLTIGDVAPGIWFALFGAGLLVVSLTQGIAYSSTTVAGDPASAGNRGTDAGRIIYADTMAAAVHPDTTDAPSRVDTINTEGSEGLTQVRHYGRKASTDPPQPYATPNEKPYTTVTTIEQYRDSSGLPPQDSSGRSSQPRVSPPR